MEVLLLDHRLDDFLRRDGRTDGSQPSHIPFPNGFVVVERQDLQYPGSDATEVDKHLNKIGCFSNQPLSSAVVDLRQITAVRLSDTGPGMGPEPVRKCADQMLEDLEAHLDFEPVAVGQDHVLGIKGKSDHIRMNRSVPSATNTKRTFSPIGFQSRSKQRNATSFACPYSNSR